MSFVHLHNHSDCSLLDGLCKIDRMIDWAVRESAPAIAITDHGNMHGAWDFYTAATEKGVKPIIGCEFYVAPHSLTEKSKEQSTYHLTLIAENNTGYKNLLKLNSVAYIDGFYRKPRIDIDLLAAHSEGIILLTGCIQGQLAQLALHGRNSESLTYFQQILDIMPQDNVFIEVQNHWLEDELKIYPELAKLAKEQDLPIVGTNDCHYISKEEHKTHDIMLCVQMKKSVNDQNRLKFDNHFYFKTREEMEKALEAYPVECIHNTFVIADRCDVRLEKLENTLPNYEDIPEGYTQKTYLKHLCEQGLIEKYGDINQTMRERLDRELEVISKTGYEGYFLVVWDYVNWSHKRNYPLAARGSAGGSLALYSLGITHFNPLDYGCLFERFLNVDRKSMPDIDIDFGDTIRDDVIEYVRQKYGKEHVARVATFSKLSQKSVLHDVGRALDIPSSVTKSISNELSENTEDLTEELRKIIEDKKENYPDLHNLPEICEQLDGIKRHVSCHAAAVVITDEPLTNYIPLFKDKNDQVISQFDGTTLEKLGIVKFDFLGSKSLMQIQNCLTMIKEKHDDDIDLNKIPMNDEKVYDLICNGLLEGLFQLDGSAGIQSITKDIAPKTFEEFLSITALYRPGPLGSGMTKQYIDRKNGKEAIKALHPQVAEILKETYGVCVYQEQVMQIAVTLGNFTPEQADILRSAISKLDKEKLQAQRASFVEGAMENGVAKNEAEQIFTAMESFGGYGFNKSHTVAYSLLAYRMAYLKNYYPWEFMACVMTRDCDNAKKMLKYMNECKRLEEFLGIGIDILPPHVNRSAYEFTTTENSIQIGLGCIKNVSQNMVDNITAEREKNGLFESVENFCKRLPTKKVPKKAVECLIQAGAFEGIEEHRALSLHNIDKFLNSSSRKDPHEGQTDLFALLGNSIDIPEVESNIELDKCEEWDVNEQRLKEKEVMGFSVSEHPLLAYKEIVKNYVSCDIEEIADSNDNQEVIVCGVVANIKKRKTRKGNDMVAFDLEGISDKLDCVLFDLTEDNMPVEHTIMLVSGNATQPTNWSSGAYKLTVKKIMQIKDLPKLTTDCEIIIPSEYNTDTEKLTQLQNILRTHKGDTGVLFRMHTPESGDVLVRCGSKFNVNPNEELTKDVNQLFDKESCFYSNWTTRDSLFKGDWQ